MQLCKFFENAVTRLNSLSPYTEIASAFTPLSVICLEECCHRLLSKKSGLQNRDKYEEFNAVLKVIPLLQIIFFLWSIIYQWVLLS